MELAKRIKLIRKAANLTQSEMAEKLGVSQPSYSEMETKADNCAFYTLQKVAEALNVSVPFLVDLENTEYKEKPKRKVSNTAKVEKTDLKVK